MSIGPVGSIACQWPMSLDIGPLVTDGASTVPAMLAGTSEAVSSIRHPNWESAALVHRYGKRPCFSPYPVSLRADYVFPVVTPVITHDPCGDSARGSPDRLIDWSYFVPPPKADRKRSRTLIMYQVLVSFAYD